MATGDEKLIGDLEKGGDQVETSFANDENLNVKDALIQREEDAKKKTPAEEFYGLSREDLEKYAKDPKWVKARWILFGLFIAGWIAMLVAAIVIVVITPKCPPAPDLKWYQSGVMYKVKTSMFLDTDGDGVGDVTGLTQKVDHFDELGIDTVWLEDVISSVLDAPRAEFGTMEDLKEMTRTFKKKGIRVMMNLSLVGATTDSDLYKNSKDYFLEKSKTCQGSEESDICAENLWKVKGSSTYFSPEGDLPRFDLSSPTFGDKLVHIFRAWAAAGIDGFVVKPAERQQNAFLSLVEKLQMMLDDEFNKLDDRDRLIIPVGRIDADTEDSPVQAVVVQPKVNCSSDSQAKCNAKGLILLAQIDNTAKPWEIPQIGNKLSVGTPKCQLALKMTVAGTPSVEYGDEIGELAEGYMRWNDDDNGGFSTKANFTLEDFEDPVASVQAEKSDGFIGTSQFNLFAQLASIREEEPSLSWGDMKVQDFGGNTQVFIRQAEGHDPIVVALNVDDNIARSGSIAVGDREVGEVLVVDGPSMEAGNTFDANAVYLPPGGILIAKLLYPEE